MVQQPKSTPNKPGRSVSNHGGGAPPSRLATRSQAAPYQTTRTTTSTPTRSSSTPRASTTDGPPICNIWTGIPVAAFNRKPASTSVDDMEVEADHPQANKLDTNEEPTIPDSDPAAMPEDQDFLGEWDVDSEDCEEDDGYGPVFCCPPANNEQFILGRPIFGPHFVRAKMVPEGKKPAPFQQADLDPFRSQADLISINRDNRASTGDDSTNPTLSGNSHSGGFTIDRTGDTNALLEALRATLEPMNRGSGCETLLSREFYERLSALSGLDEPFRRSRLQDAASHVAHEELSQMQEDAPNTNPTGTAANGSTGATAAAASPAFPTTSAPATSGPVDSQNQTTTTDNRSGITVDDSIAARMELIMQRTARDNNLSVATATRPRAAPCVPVQIFPSIPAIDYPFDCLPDPNRRNNVPAFTHRFRYLGPQVNVAEHPRFRGELREQLLAFLARNEAESHFVVDKPERFNGSTYVDIVCADKDTYRRVHNAPLQFDRRPFEYVKSGAPMVDSQIFIRFSGMSLAFDHGNLLTFLVTNFGRIFNIQGVWILNQENAFTGISFVLGEFLDGFYGPRRFPGWISIKGREIRLDYDGRPDWCKYCRSKNADGHLSDECRRNTSRLSTFAPQ